MFNLIKMDMYRLLHSASFRVMLIVTAAIAVFSISMTNLDIQEAQKNPASVSEETASEPPTGLVITDQTSEAQFGIYVTANEEWASGGIDLFDVISMELQSGLTALLCVIFTALFANADQKSGYIKNIAGQVPRREKLIAAKLTAIAVQVFLLLLVYIAVACAASFFFWGDRLYASSPAVFLKLLAVQYLLHLGLAAFIMFFTILSRSTAFSMTAGILICSGLTSILYTGINQVIANLRPGWNFDITRYVLEGNITMTELDTISDTILRSVSVGMVFILLSAALSMITIKKRDI